MAARFTDAEIAQLLAEPKSLPDGYQARLQLRPRSGHERAELEVRTPSGNRFRILLRQNMRNALDFSAIVAHVPSTSTLLFRLRRYNGRSHEHTNRLEDTTFYDFHIHTATERYQDLEPRRAPSPSRATALPISAGPSPACSMTAASAGPTSLSSHSLKGPSRDP